MFVQWVFRGKGALYWQLNFHGSGKMYAFIEKKRENDKASVVKINSSLVICSSLYYSVTSL